MIQRGAQSESSGGLIDQEQATGQQYSAQSTTIVGLGVPRHKTS